MGDVLGAGRVCILAAALAVTACSSSKSDANGGSSSTGGGSGSPGGGSSNPGGGSSNPGGGSSNPGGGGNTMMAIPTVPGEVDPNAPAGTALKPVPALINVAASTTGDSVSISFDPIDGAVDYRVYELPANDAISTTTDGYLTVQNATYRCAGNRQTPAVTLDGAKQVQSGGAKTLVDGQDIDGYKRSLAEATIGYVWALPDKNRVPVYALGDSAPKGDIDCYFMRWTASRSKRYVTSIADRDALLKKGFRDDGIAFYVPAAASDATVQISTSVKVDAKYGDTQYYFPDASPEAAARTGAKPAFIALAAAADAAVPLKRVFYQNGCGESHDELVAGEARFERARRQGDQLPVWDLHWSGLKGPTTLVVEALDQGCPYPGFLSTKATPAFTTPPGFSTMYNAWLTVDDARAASKTGELFINGQFDGDPKPRPIARSFIKVAPAPAPDLDWSYGFKSDDTLGALKDIPCGSADGNCYGQARQASDTVETEFFLTQENRLAQGPLFGELWVTYSDAEADTNGKFRLTPLMKATMTDNSFIYAREEVDSFTTGRRYPQILISDRDTPVQIQLAKGNTLVLQTFADWPNVYQLEVCDHKNWDVNDQCPAFDFYHQFADAANPDTVTGLAPVPEVGEHAGLDRSTLLEIYTSTKRAYLFLDGLPFGCADLPTAGVPKGPVTVTFGDVLYHSAADALFDFTGKKLNHDTVRHFDNLGFKSNVAAPKWDEARFPCTGTLHK